jgi:hypothetical protein
MSKKNAIINPERIHLITVNIIKAHLDTSETFLENPRKIEAFEFGVARDIAHNFQEGRSRYRLFFTLNALDPNETPLGVEIEYGIEFHFYVENFKDFTRQSEEGVMQVDAALGATLLGMAYSTARGIVFERTRGTFFEGVILPVIDPFELLMEKGKLKPKKSTEQ